MRSPSEHVARRRRIVRRAVIALAVVVLLVVSYVSGYGASYWLDAHSDRFAADESDYYLFAPLEVYCRSGLPGARTLRAFRVLCYWQGTGMPRVPLLARPAVRTRVDVQSGSWVGR